MFANRPLVIATKHHKEAVIAPLLEKELGVKCFSDTMFDTDSLGTFTGEVQRLLDPLAAAREKCHRAMDLNKCDLAVASEGSFGPHPSVPFVPVDEEVLVFIDRKHQLEIVVNVMSLDTNFNARSIRSEKELMEFADAVGFPSHGLILRPSATASTGIYKGITEEHELRKIFHLLMAGGTAVYVETDMRAMHNPSRMKVIAQAAAALVARIKSNCPKCELPGFGVVDVTRGLPCSLCGAPTRAIRSHIYECKGCSFREERLYPEGRTTEDPMYCDHCNP